MKVQELEQDVRKALDEEKILGVKNYLKKLLFKLDEQERTLAQSKERYQKCLDMSVDELFQHMMSM